MDKTSEHLEPLPPGAAAELERIVARFEGGWGRGERPPLGAYLPPAEPLRRAVLVELVHADLEGRLKAGEPARLETYLRSHPDLAADRAAVLALLAREFELRRRREPALAADEYVRRFPRLAADLRPRLAAPGRADVADSGRAAPAPAPRPARPPVGGVADLVRSLQECRVLESSCKEELAQLQGRFGEPRDLARELLQRGWLTPFQMNQIFQGHGGDLVLGPYVLLERLGQGGMGAVYKARHQMMKRAVALKVLHPGGLTGTAIQRFQQEIEAAAVLSHPHIVTAFDAGRSGDVFYFAMEHLEGATLHHVVEQRGPLPFAEACWYARQAALALQHAHEKKLVHRDLKPSNLFLTTGGTVKLLDLGLARVQERAAEGGGRALTRLGSIMGTPDYMPPEQITDVRGVDIRGDLYSLGCTLYFLLTARTPFGGKTILDKLDAQLKTPPPSVRARRPDVPESLDAVLQKMMAKRREDRYATPGEVNAALAPFAPGPGAALPVPATEGPARAVPEETVALAGSPAVPPLPTVGPTPPPSGSPPPLPGPGPGLPPRRAFWRRGRVLLGAGVLLLLAALPGVGLWLRQPPAEERPAAKETTNAAGLKEITNSLGMRLVRLPAGRFVMGSPRTEPGRDAGGTQPSLPQEVVLAPFYVGACEVTVGQFRSFVRASGYVMPEEASHRLGEPPVRGRNWEKPGWPQGDDHPVLCVSWDDANAFCAWLGKREGKPYRLPSEAEWEYACRAGTRTTYFFGDDPKRLGEYAWVGSGPQPVGRKKPNPWGLYDMYGNAWEWTGTRSEGGRECLIVRGGGWTHGPEYCRSSCRIVHYGQPTNGRYDWSGFRVVRAADY